MRAYITNHGENYENHLLLWIDGEMKTGLGAYVDLDKSDYVDFCTGAPAKGTHNLKITTDFARNDVIFTDQLTITEAPEYQLTSENIIEGIGSDEKIHTSKHSATTQMGVAECLFLIGFFHTKNCKAPLNTFKTMRESKRAINFFRTFASY